MKKIKRNFLLALAASGLLMFGGANVTSHANSRPYRARTHMTVHHRHSNYYRRNPHIIEVKRDTNVYKNMRRTRKAFEAGSGEFYHIRKAEPRYHDLQTYGHEYITANHSYVKKSHGYQTPGHFYGIHYKQIKGARHIPSIGLGWEGMRTYEVSHRLGVPDGHNEYTYATKYAVERFQRAHHLPVTGRVNYRTWRKMGFSKHSWYSLDNYIPKESFKPWQGRWAHINAGIRHIKKYLGGVWISGTSSSPYYKKADCSGLAMQYLLAGGIYAKGSGTPMLHASPNNEWDSQKLWASPRLKWEPFADRQRGDLIFYRDPSTGNIWHVGVIVSRTGGAGGLVIDSWPPYIQYHSVYSGHGTIAGVKRPFM